MDMFHLAQRQVFDEPRFQVYLSIGRSLASLWMSSDDDSNKGITFERHLTSFDASRRSTSGHSMEILWKKLKPITASSMDLLARILEFEALGEKFDALAWRSYVSLERLAELRNALVFGYLEAIKDQTSVHITEVKSCPGINTVIDVDRTWILHSLRKN